MSKLFINFIIKQEAGVCFNRQPNKAGKKYNFILIDFKQTLIYFYNITMLKRMNRQTKDSQS